MLLDRNKHSESAYIGEELFSDPKKDRLHRCMVAEQAISDGDFPLDEALEAYCVSEEEYENYVARKSNANIFTSISGSVTNNTTVGTSFAMPVYFEVFTKMIEESFDEKLHILFDHRLNRIKDELQQISRELKEKV